MRRLARLGTETPRARSPFAVFFGFFDPDKLRTNVYNVQPDLGKY